MYNCVGPRRYSFDAGWDGLGRAGSSLAGGRRKLRILEKGLWRDKLGAVLFILICMANSLPGSARNCFWINRFCRSLRVSSAGEFYWQEGHFGSSYHPSYDRSLSKDRNSGEDFARLMDRPFAYHRMDTFCRSDPFRSEARF